VNNSKAVFAGGCFWCVEHDLRSMAGVVNAYSGYCGGEGNPSYENHVGYREAVMVLYDNTKISYKKLCQFFLDHIDPTDGGGQFYDRGESYKTAIYYETQEEEEIAKSLIEELDSSGVYDDPVATEVLPLQKFYNAEEYHQKYASKNPAHYEAYSEGSGRKEFVNRVCMIRDEKKIKWRE